MDTDAKIIFRAFFNELEKRGIPNVILHSYQNLPDQIGSDIDYAVCDADIPLVHAILEETTSREGWLLAQMLQYDIASYYTVLVNPQHPGMALKLDRCSHYTRNGCLFIRDEVLLENRKQFNGFSIPCASSEFIYTLAKVFAKGKEIANYIPRLRELYSADPKRSEELFHHVFGTDAGALTDWFNRPAAEWYKLSVPMHDRNRYKLPHRAREWRRRLRRFLNPTGLNVAVWGGDQKIVDEFISKIETAVEPCFRRRIRLAPRTGGCFKQWKIWFSQELPAYQRSTFMVVAHGEKELERLASSPQPDLLFWLGDTNSAPNKNLITLGARNMESAVATAWREIVNFLSKRQERRSPFPKPH